MPKYWYDFRSCKTDFQKEICADKKPYFMTYVYSDYRVKYNKFMKEADKTQLLMFGDDEPDEDFKRRRESKNPFGLGPCAMNRICWYIEEEFRGQKSRVRKASNFDYRILKYDYPYSSESKAQMQQLAYEYAAVLHENAKHKDARSSSDGNNLKVFMEKHYREEAARLVPNEKERFDIVLDLYYSNSINRLFGWITVGHTYIKRLRELRDILG